MRQFSFPHTPIIPVLIFVQTYGCLHLIQAEFKIVMSVYVEIMPVTLISDIVRKTKKSIYKCGKSKM